MNRSRPIAFYAPLKSPNHPSPSGDRTMARLLMNALGRAGFTPLLAGELRTLDKGGDPAMQDRLRVQSAEEAKRLIAHYQGQEDASRPCLWFTYHVYYKAPDWIGPQVADALGIPYAVAEGSRAMKRAKGPWALGHSGAEAALDRADAVFVMTAQDRTALENARPPHQRLIGLPPFLDAEGWPLPAPHTSNAVPRLLTVAMMRAGDKLASYRILAEALAIIRALPWTLDIVGDGEARGEIERLLRPFGSRIRFHGEIGDRIELQDIYQKADLFVWPAVNEAYGMVLLEAGALGCPAVAGAFGGVASVVRDGETGLLTRPGDPRAFAEAVASLLSDRERLRRLGAAALTFVRGERNLGSAAERLRAALMPLLPEATA